MSEPVKFSDLRHIVHVAVIIVVLLVAFLIARSATVPKDFGEYGHYRGASLDERKNLPVVFQTPQTCRECHDRESESGVWPGFRAWQGGKHSVNTCENCHSGCKEHVELWKGNPDLVDTWRDQPNEFKTRKDQLGLKDPVTKGASRDVCVTCHRALAARPTVLKSYDAEKHAPYYKALKMEEKDTTCTVCHDAPHSP